MTERLALEVGGRAYEGWTSVGVELGIEQVAGRFDLGLTERWPGQTEAWPIPAGEFCRVTIGGEPVISGYVDTVSVSYESGSHAIRAAGRDVTGDLVDCSAPSRAWSGLTLLEVARVVCEPYGIAVRDETLQAGRTPLRLPKQAAQQSETCHRLLERMARIDGVLLASDGQGALILTRAGLGGDAEAALEWGVNILAASLETSHAALYSEITVKGQAAAAGMDATGFAVVAGASHTVGRASVPAATSGNASVLRHRPLVIVAEGQADAARCKTRAEWETANREARARKLSVTVQGWRERDGGALWRPNRRVRVRCPWMRTDERWLVARVRFTLDGGGTRAQLDLVDERAFTPQPQIPQPGTATGAPASRFGVVAR